MPLPNPSAVPEVHELAIYFANLVSVGLSAHVAATVRHDLERLLGRAAYPLTALAQLPRHRPFQATITTGAKPWNPRSAGP